MDEVEQDDITLRRNPGFGTARTVFLDELKEWNCVGSRVRIVGA